MVTRIAHFSDTHVLYAIVDSLASAPFTISLTVLMDSSSKCGAYPTILEVRLTRVGVCRRSVAVRRLELPVLRLRSIYCSHMDVDVSLESD